MGFSQALRTLFNVAHRLAPLLGPSWPRVLETLDALDRILHSPRTTTQARPTGTLTSNVISEGGVTRSTAFSTPAHHRPGRAPSRT